MGHQHISGLLNTYRTVFRIGRTGIRAMRIGQIFEWSGRGGCKKQFSGPLTAYGLPNARKEGREEKKGAKGVPSTGNAGRKLIFREMNQKQIPLGVLPTPMRFCIRGVPATRSCVTRGETCAARAPETLGMNRDSRNVYCGSFRL